MRISRPLAVVIGVLTALSVANTVYSFAASTLAAWSAVGQGVPPIARPASHFSVAVGALSMVVFLLLLAFYIVHIVKTPAHRDGRRSLWLLAILFVGVVAMPIYWFLFVWRTPPPAPPPLLASLPPLPPPPAT